MLSSNKSYKNIKVSLTIHCKYNNFDSTVQKAEDRRQKFYFCRLPFAVNVKLNLSNEYYLLLSVSLLFIIILFLLFKDFTLKLPGITFKNYRYNLKMSSTF